MSLDFDLECVTPAEPLPEAMAFPAFRLFATSKLAVIDLEETPAEDWNAKRRLQKQEALQVTEAELDEFYKKAQGLAVSLDDLAREASSYRSKGKKVICIGSNHKIKPPANGSGRYPKRKSRLERRRIRERCNRPPKKSSWGKKRK
ncbi:hypothetical protein HDU91_007439 [Kappamyces sp. JEL0680]|nr:hypothetical protein HDU91_007439 [Kappamyces sp. JEL0680]